MTSYTLSDLVEEVLHEPEAQQTRHGHLKMVQDGGDVDG